MMAGSFPPPAPNPATVAPNAPRILPGMTAAPNVPASAGAPQTAMQNAARMTARYGGGPQDMALLGRSFGGGPQAAIGAGFGGPSTAVPFFQPTPTPSAGSVNQGGPLSPLFAQNPASRNATLAGMGVPPTAAPNAEHGSSLAELFSHTLDQNPDMWESMFRGGR